MLTRGPLVSAFVFVLLFASLSAADEVFKWRMYYQSQYNGEVRLSRSLYDTEQQAKDAAAEMRTVHAVADAWVRKVKVVNGKEIAPYQIGDVVKVLWGAKWWDAKVLKVEGDKCFITYPGWGAEWDEWVPPSRIRPAK